MGSPGSDPTLRDASRHRSADSSDRGCRCVILSATSRSCFHSPSVHRMCAKTQVLPAKREGATRFVRFPTGLSPNLSKRCGALRVVLGIHLLNAKVAIELRYHNF